MGIYLARQGLVLPLSVPLNKDGRLDILCGNEGPQGAVAILSTRMTPARKAALSPGRRESLRSACCPSSHGSLVGHISRMSRVRVRHANQGSSMRRQGCSQNMRFSQAVLPHVRKVAPRGNS
jgi:hypothetical protein